MSRIICGKFHLFDVVKEANHPDKHFVVIGYDKARKQVVLREFDFEDKDKIENPNIIFAMCRDIKISHLQLSEYCLDRYSTPIYWEKEIIEFIEKYKKYKNLELKDEEEIKVFSDIEYAISNTMKYLDYNDAKSYGKFSYKTYDLGLDDCEENIKNRVFKATDDFLELYDKHFSKIIKEIKDVYSCYIEPKKIVTDLEVGIFDMDRASIMLEQEFGYWSKKHQKFVQFNEISYNPEKQKYYLTEDKSEIETKPLFLDKNKPKAISKNRKSYITIEDVLWKTKKVRIITEIGGAWVRPAEYFIARGYATVSLAKMLEEFGFSVSIVFTLNVEEMATSWEFKGKKYYNPYSVTMVEVKKFEDELNIPYILQVVANPSYFRSIGFVDICMKYFKYKAENPDKALGREVSLLKVKSFMFQENFSYSFDKDLILLPVPSPSGKQTNDIDSYIIENVKDNLIRTIDYMVENNSYKKAVTREEKFEDINKLGLKYKCQ